MSSLLYRLRPDPTALPAALVLFSPAIPFAFIVGLAATTAELPLAAGWLSSVVMFAGAAQLAVISIAGATSWWAAIVAGLVINSRHVMYSMAMAPAFKNQPRWMRWIAPHFLIDQVFAMVILRAEDEPEDFRRYYLTCAAVFFTGWNISVALGVKFGGSIPLSWRLDFAPAVMFAGLVIMGVARRSHVVAILVGSLACYATIGLPNKLSIVVGGVCGVIAGALADRLDK